MTTLNPAERYAALKLLSDGISAALSDAQAEAEAYRRGVRARSLETDFGQVSITRRQPSIRYDEAALLDWCRDELPNLVQTVVSIPAGSRAWLAKHRHTIVGGDVVDEVTGEVVPWAHVVHGSEYLTFRADPAARAAAIASVAERVDLLTAALPTPPAKES